MGCTEIVGSGRPEPSLRFHADQLASSGTGLLPGDGVLEPQNVRNQRGVPQEKQFRHLPRDHHREQWRQEPMRQAEPYRANDEANHGSHHHLAQGVVLKVDPTVTHQEGGHRTNE